MTSTLNVINYSTSDEGKAKISKLRPSQDLNLRSQAFEQTTRAEMNISNVSQPDRIGNELNFDCLCLDIHLLLITYKLLLIYYSNYY